ncbi:aromatic acid decarboxylase, partial [Streptomyces scabiei]|nr:aromatic acid decarboxylase [Streptomyces scabiei]
GAHGAGAAEQDLLPVLAARDVAVREQVGRMFPETVTTRVRGVSDLAGWQQGAEAADRAQVRARPRLPS